MISSAEHKHFVLTFFGLKYKPKPTHTHVHVHMLEVFDSPHKVSSKLWFAAIIIGYHRQFSESPIVLQGFDKGVGQQSKVWQL